MTDTPPVSEPGTVEAWLADILAGRVEVTGVETFQGEVVVEIREVDGGPPAGEYVLAIEDAL